MEEIEFKFEPVWVSILGLIGLYFIYLFFKDVVPVQKYDQWSTFPIIFVLVIPGMLLPIFIKMLLGIPAIKLTSNQLVNNVLGVKVDWSNISDIRIAGTRKPFVAITLKDKHEFLQSISNPVKRFFLRIMFLLSPGDTSVNLAFVAGDNEAISAVIKVYWSRYYGSDE